MFGLEDTRKRRKRLEEIAKALEERRATADETLAQGSVLSKSARNPYYSYFHADLVKGDDDESSIIFIHLRYRVKPTSPAPKLFLQRKEKGLTLEWLTQEMLDLIDEDETYFSVDVEAELLRPVELKAAVMAPPLAPGLSLLRCSGVEYSAEDSAEGEPGVRKFRWSKRSDDRIWTWLTYEYLSNTLDLKPWTQEVKRCVTYLHQLL